jgi:hypothetical protein
MNPVNQAAVILAALVIAMSAPLSVHAQQSASASVRTAPSAKTEAPTMNQKIIEKKRAEDYAASKGKGGGPEGKGNPGPLPCKSKNNPKCEPATPSKHSTGMPHIISE